MATKRTVDNRMTYWFLWKHPMAGRRVLEFGVFDQTPRKLAPRLGSTGLAARSSFLHKTTKAKASARPFGPRHSSLSAPLHENTTQMWARPCGLAFQALKMHQAPIFHPSMSASRYRTCCPAQNYQSQSIGSALRIRHSSLSAPLHENTTQMWARPCGLAFRALQMHQATWSRTCCA